MQLLIEHAPYSEFLEHPFCSEGKSWPARHRGDIHHSRYSKQAGVGAALNGYGFSLCCAPGLQAASFQGGKVWSGDAPFAALPSAAWEQALLKVTSVLDGCIFGMTRFMQDTNSRFGLEHELCMQPFFLETAFDLQNLELRAKLILET